MPSLVEAGFAVLCSEQPCLHAGGTYRDLGLSSLLRALGEDGPYQKAVVNMSRWEFLRSSLHEDKVSLPLRMLLVMLS